MTKSTLLLWAFTLCACSGHDPYLTKQRGFSAYGNYERYEPSLVQLARMRASGDGTDAAITVSGSGYTVADIDVINYTDHVKAILRKKFTNARFARYTSATAQVGLAAASGIAAAFSAGTTLIASLGFGSAAVPQIGEIFNARVRAGIYQDAVSKIEDAESAYYAFHASPPIDKYTIEADVLYKNVTGNIHTVEKMILGELPDLKAVEDANHKSKLPEAKIPETEQTR